VVGVGWGGTEGALDAAGVALGALLGLGDGLGAGLGLSDGEGLGDGDGVGRTGVAAAWFWAGAKAITAANRINPASRPPTSAMRTMSRFDIGRSVPVRRVRGRAAAFRARIGRRWRPMPPCAAESRLPC
jgi:hypothetical protein